MCHRLGFRKKKMIRLRRGDKKSRRCGGFEFHRRRIGVEESGALREESPLGKRIIARRSSNRFEKYRTCAPLAQGLTGGEVAVRLFFLLSGRKMQTRTIGGLSLLLRRMEVLLRSVDYGEWHISCFCPRKKENYPLAMGRSRIRFPIRKRVFERLIRETAPSPSRASVRGR